PAVEDALVKLAAAAAGYGVVDQGVMVDMLAAVPEEETVEATGSALAGETHVDVRARERGAERKRIGEKRAAALLERHHAADVECLLALALHRVVFDDRPLVERDLGDRIREVGLAVGARVRFDDPRLRAMSRDDEGARLAH